EFAVGVLRHVSADLAVTRPDRPAGRGRALSSPPVALAAKEMGIPVAQPQDVNAFDLSGYDDVVVCAFGAWIKEPLLSHTGLINIHPSLLPRWRGAAPLERAIMAGDAETGVCIMGVVEELDAGPVHLVEREPIWPDDTYGALAARLQPIAADLLERYLVERPPGQQQGNEGMTYAEKIKGADRLLDAGRSPDENARVVRALSPHIGAKAGELGVWLAAPLDGEAVEPGALAVSEGRLLWGCAGGALELLEVQPPGKRRMAAADYARGL
ncbi:MAG: methionyl-tRNA formyltransferase, partial [Solirubrobacteraceae bacterium]|nr:methionyl-tRNA formyltransferase [Solirubrobacteraceae bacterium]